MLVKHSAARILVVAGFISPLTLERAFVGQAGGYSVYWYSLPRQPLDNISGFDGPPAFRSRLLQHLTAPFYLYRAMRRFKPDLIHVHWGLQRLQTPLLTRFHPLVVTVMAGEILPEQVYRGINPYFVNPLLRAADVITSKSDFTDEALRQIGFEGSQVKRITWGVDTEKFRSGLNTDRLRQQWQIEPDDFVFLSVRNCRILYNIHLIVEAFANCLAQSKRKIKLLISEAQADPVYCQKIKVLVNRLQIEPHIRFVGPIPHSEMPFYYNLANTVVSVPTSDGMPQSLYESMACGVFHVLGDLPSYYELIQHEHNGYLVPVNNSTALADAMIWCLDHPDQLTEAAQLGRDQVLQIANKKVETQRMNDIYAQLLNQFN